jgi:radical SAM protein with 4Fe4S-binding SPASM domain
VKYRHETFGGIIASEDPPFLAFVDRQFMRQQGLGESPRWQGADERVGLLSAPTEVHLAATGECPVRCPHCYMDSGQRVPGELDSASFRRALRVLAGMRVFHVALGGGEALVRPDIFELAGYARELGLVPNLTISGAVMSPQMARRMTVFGQVNVSLDGVGRGHGAFRDPQLFLRADAAIRALVDAGVPTGINCVLGRDNFGELPGLFDYGRRRGVNELEFLRLKPVGRGRRAYAAHKTTAEQNLALTPLLARLSQASGLTAKIDCSFVPMMCHHRPPPELLEATATYGCEAGNVLVGVDSAGTVHGCSFLGGAGMPLWELPARWERDPRLQWLRSWPERAPEPCRSCAYLQLCKGGCHAVAEFVCGDAQAPDPDCPGVVAQRRAAAP